MIIGLAGYARSGKDTVAKSLKLRYGFERVAFADCLKKLALELDPVIAVNDGWDHSTLRAWVEQYGWETAKQTPDVREFLQRLGHGLREIIDPLIWIKAAGAEAMGHVADGRSVVFTDVRYENEAEYIRTLGGVLVRVVRPGVEPVNDHITDNALDSFDYDYVFNNETTVNDIGSRVTEMINYFETV